MPAIASAINVTIAAAAANARVQRLQRPTVADDVPSPTGGSASAAFSSATSSTSSSSSMLADVLQSLSNISSANTPASSLSAMGMHGNAAAAETAADPVFPSPPPSTTLFSTLSIESLVASSSEDLSGFRDVTFDIFDEDGDDMFGSPLAFDASDNGLWNGRFVPPPPRPPFFVDEPVISDGLTTCDLCSWAMPTKSTFIFEGTIEKASELGWPLTLIIVSILSAVLGAIIMVTVVHCRRNKNTNNRNADTHVQWWARHKRSSVSAASNSLGLAALGAHGIVTGSNSSLSSRGSANVHQHTNMNIINNNISAGIGLGLGHQMRRGNIYTAHPADSMRASQANVLRPNAANAAATTTTTTTISSSISSSAQPTANDAHGDLYYHHYHHHHGATPQRLVLRAAPTVPPPPPPPLLPGNEQPEYHQPHELHLQMPPPPPPSSSLSSQTAGGSGCHWPSPSMIVAS